MLSKGGKVESEPLVNVDISQGRHTESARHPSKYLSTRSELFRMTSNSLRDSSQCSKCITKSILMQQKPDRSKCCCLQLSPLSAPIFSSSPAAQSGNEL